MSAKKFFFVMLAVFVIAVAGSVAGIILGDKLLKSKSDNVANLLAERDAQADVINKLKTSSASASDIDELNQLIGSVLPDEKRQEDLIGDLLFTATSQAGIGTDQITNINFTGSGAPDALSGAVKSKTVNGVYEYPFNIELSEVPYTTMLEFFNQLESNKRIIATDTVQLTPDPLNPSIMSSISLSLKTYLQP